MLLKMLHITLNPDIFFEGSEFEARKILKNYLVVFRLF
jgi:hypothetical protein